MTAMTIGCCGLLLCGGTAWAGGFDMKPGKWESTTTMTMPMMPTPTTMTNVQCVTEEQAQQDKLDLMLAEGRCEPLRTEEGDGRIDFEVRCQGDAGTAMTGTGYFEVHGDQASGAMEMTMAMPEMPSGGPHEMTIHQEWQARRLGPCD